MKSQSADRLSEKKRVEDQEDDIEVYRNKRNILYKNALEANSSNIRGAASFYAAEAREANTVFKNKQKERQMERYHKENVDIGRNKLDLHYLTTGDAIKELQQFIATREASLRYLISWHLMNCDV